MKQIGKRHRAIDWESRTTGNLAYAGDIRIDGLLEAAVLRSPHPHAKILRIDTQRARTMPGVHAVITAADFPAGAHYIHEGAADRAPLADGVARFIGQEIVAVAAETAQQAQAALRAVEVEYELLPGPLTTAEALGGRKGRLHQRPTGKPNVSHRMERDWGTTSAGRLASQLSVSGRFVFPRQAHACMETNVSVASWDAERQRLHCWTSTQAPYYVVKEAAHVLGLREDQIVCHEVGVGGGFGSKSKICDHEAIAGALAIAALRPVRLQLSREEEFETTKTRHQFDIAMRLHADASGRLRAIEADIDVENGAYDHSGVSVMSAGIKGLGMLYRPDGVTVMSRLVDTALPPGGAFRGYGTTQTGFALECLMDDLAAQLNIDPIELRLRNANQTGETTLVGARLGSARLTECLCAVRAAINWDSEKANRRPGRGVGVSSAVHVSGSHVGPGANRSDAAIDIFANGRIRVRFGGADAGTGQKTILAQIVAEELGVELNMVDVLTMDSDRTPFDMGAWSSRGTHYGGHAVRQASLMAAQRLKALAAAYCGEGESWLQNGMVHGKGFNILLGDLVSLSGEADGALTIEASFVDTSVMPADRATGIGNVSASYNFACHAAVVDVDCRTGQVKVLDYVAAHDVGIALNPTAAEGQAIGGAVMGLGLALGEEVLYEQGKMVNPAYLHYALPRAADVPPIRPILIEGGDPRGPYGAKAIGECGINPPASVIANAIFDAIGVRITSLPITPDKILNALAQREGRRRRHFIWRRPSRWWIALVRWAYPRGLLDVLHKRTTHFTSHCVPTPLEKIEMPAALAQVFGMLGRNTALLGGGTDLQLRRRQGLVEVAKLVSTRKVAELQGIKSLADGTIEIGSAVTLSSLADTMRARIPVIAQAVDTIASTQIREMATVGGNLAQEKRCWFYRNGFGCFKRLGGLAPCYAVNGDHRFYHAVIDGHRCQATTPSDLATVLAGLGAQAAIASSGGERIVPIEKFFSGPGETVLAENEVLRAIRLPSDATRRIGNFAKLRLWEGDFAVVSVALTARLDAGTATLREPRIVFGGLAPTPWRAVCTEKQIEGASMSVAAFRTLLDHELDRAAHPLPRNGWKLDAAAGLAEQAFESMLTMCKEVAPAQPEKRAAVGESVAGML